MVFREAVGEILEEVEQRTTAIVVEFLGLLGAGPGRLAVLRHAVRQVAIDAARTVVGRVQTRTADRLVGVHQVFAFAEGIQRHGHRTDVEGVTADPQQVVEDARDFVEHRADVLAAFRHFDLQQLLYAEAVGVFVAHRRHIVETVHVGHRLDPGPGLGQLFGGAVEQTDVRVGALDDFAVHLQHQTQHAVRGRVLRTEVEGVVADISHVPDPRRCLRGRCAACSRAVRW